MNNIINYIKVMRPQTLIASIAPVTIAYKQAISEGMTVNIDMIVACLIIGICIQIATNIFNDIIDGKNGVDENRVGPKRMTSSKVIPAKNLYIISLICLFLAGIASIPLVGLNIIYLPIGLTCLFFSYGYTGGPYPLAYNKLGELFVFIYFIILLLGKKLMIMKTSYYI